MDVSQNHPVGPYPDTYGTKIAEAVAPVSRTASRTFAKTGLPRCVSPAFFGLVPPTTFVPIWFLLDLIRELISPVLSGDVP